MRERVGMGYKAGNGEVQHGKESGEGGIGWEDVAGEGGLRGYGWSDCIGGHGWGEHEVGRLGAVGVCWSSACMGVWCEWREARRVRGRGRSSPFVYLVV